MRQVTRTNFSKKYKWYQPAARSTKSQTHKAGRVSCPETHFWSWQTIKVDHLVQDEPWKSTNGYSKYNGNKREVSNNFSKVNMLSIKSLIGIDPYTSSPQLICLFAFYWFWLLTDSGFCMIIWYELYVCYHLFSYILIYHWLSCRTYYRNTYIYIYISIHRYTVPIYTQSVFVIIFEKYTNHYLYILTYINYIQHMSMIIIKYSFKCCINHDYIISLKQSIITTTGIILILTFGQYFVSWHLGYGQ